MKKVLLFLFAFVFATDSFANDIAATTTNPVCDNATLEQFNGTANVEIDWEPNVIALRWYDGDTKLNVPVESQSCVYDGAMVIPPAPTKIGYTFKGWEIKRKLVPSTYTQLEYLEGGQNFGAWLDLGYPATPTMKTLLVASVGTEYTEPDQVMFGASNNNAYSQGKAYSVDRYPSIVYIPNGDLSSAVSIIPIKIELNRIYQFKVNYPVLGQIGVDDYIKTGFTNITSVSSQNLYLFGFNGAGYYSTRYSVRSMRTYKLTIWDNGDEMIHDYVPARRNSDNVLGMWDAVTETFLTNSGTGSFVAGPPVQ